MEKHRHGSNKGNNVPWLLAWVARHCRFILDFRCQAAYVTRKAKASRKRPGCVGMPPVLLIPCAAFAVAAKSAAMPIPLNLPAELLPRPW